MAVRIPLYWTGDGFRPMSSAQINTIIDRAIYAYGTNPSVTLSYIASNGNLNAMQDTRYQAGTATLRTDRFATEIETPDISLLAPIVYDNINQTIVSATAPADTASRAFPLYLDAQNNIRPMTQVDFYDTFIKPAIDIMVSASPTDQQRSGTYIVLRETSTVPSFLSIVSNNPIYQNTTANASAYTSAGIPEALDQPSTPVNWYLYRYNAQVVTPTVFPMILRSDSDIQELSIAGLDALLGAGMRYVAASEAGYQIRYEINDPNGVPRGDAMTDTRLNGSSGAGYTQKFDGYDSYRTQEFPNGVEVVVASYQLTIRKV
jgi:hypothetical protein